MKLRLCIDVDRYEGKPLYTVGLNDIDEAVNFHSYNCIFFEQGNDLQQLIEKAKQLPEVAENNLEIKDLLGFNI